MQANIETDVKLVAFIIFIIMVKNNILLWFCLIIEEYYLKRSHNRKVLFVKKIVTIGYERNIYYYFLM